MSTDQLNFTKVYIFWVKNVDELLLWNQPGETAMTGEGSSDRGAAIPMTITKLALGFNLHPWVRVVEYDQP